MYRRNDRLRIFAFALAPAALLLVPAPAIAKPGDRERSVEVGPIWNQMDAERKCREAARSVGGAWTGEWRTTVPGRMSVCEIGGGSSGGSGGKGKTVEVGPIWNQIDAGRKCPEAARKAGATWTGEWRTTVPGRMSVCEIRR